MLVVASWRDPVIPFNGVKQYVARLRQCVAEHKKRSGDRAAWWRYLSSVVIPVGQDRETAQRLPRGMVFFLVDRNGLHDAADEVIIIVIQVHPLGHVSCGPSPSTGSCELWSQVHPLGHVSCGPSPSTVSCELWSKSIHWVM